jgi:import inner membrane translocase subunit TIM23
MWGFREGLARPLGNNASFKLRLNSVLNGCTRRGSFLGNSLGVLAIFYNIANSSMDAFRGKHDALNSMAAGAISGALYKSTGELAQMLVLAPAPALAPAMVPCWRVGCDMAQSAFRVHAELMRMLQPAFAQLWLVRVS